jgi:long-subunit fatty acid transport protein
LYWNPATITGIGDKTIQAEYADWFHDLTHSFVGFVIPTSDKGAFGFSINTLNMGTFEETTIDMPDGTGRTFGATSMAVATTYAHTLFDGFSIGGSLKYIRESIWNSTAQTFAFDVGTIFVTPFDGLRFGANIANYGGRMQMLGTDLLFSADLNPRENGDYRPDANLATNKFDLPLLMKIGFAYDAVKNNTARVSLYADGSNPSDNKQSLSLGTEIGLLNEMIQLRAGLPELFLEDRISNFTAGIGVNTTFGENLGVKIGYAYQNFRYLKGTNRISISFSF